MRIDNLYKFLTDLFFSYSTERKTLRTTRAAILVLFLGGLALWGVFLNWGRGPFNFHDWADITMPRLVFLQDSIDKGRLPLHIFNPSPLDSATDRFMAVPDVILSPQILLLDFLPIGTFILVNTWLLYSAGFAGMLWLRGKFRLSLTSFTLFFLLFNFNGHILAHFTVGHFTWGAYFLFPWFIGLIFELLDGRTGWKWTACTALWMFLVFINGGYHPFIWALFFMGFLILTNLRNFRVIIRTAIVSILLCAFRILPLLLPLKDFDDIFIAGYPLDTSIWSSLTAIQIPNDITLNEGMTRAVGLWEFTLYAGLLGTLLLLFFGVYRVITQPSIEHHYSGLLIPSLGLVILSLGKVYQYLRIAVPIPLITGERVSSRMIILPFLFVLTLAVIELQRTLDRTEIRPAVKALAPLSLVILANDLWQNFRLWRLRDASKAFEIKILDTAQFVSANHPDPDYFNMLWIGTGLSLAALILLIIFVRREKKKNRPGAVL